MICYYKRLKDHVLWPWNIMILASSITWADHVNVCSWQPRIPSRLIPIHHPRCHRWRRRWLHPATVKALQVSKTSINHCSTWVYFTPSVQPVRLITQLTDDVPVAHRQSPMLISYLFERQLHLDSVSGDWGAIQIIYASKENTFHFRFSFLHV